MKNNKQEWDWMDEELLISTKDTIQIEEILTEANAYNLRPEVMATAHAFIKEDPDLDKTSAFQMAYIEWITNKF